MRQRDDKERKQEKKKKREKVFTLTFPLYFFLNLIVQLF